ncbi:hypothetical protein FQK07_13200 [Synechococcus sp. BSF8S]|uniref:hypothetical protein n=1 Tax=Synechococcales TaxID=1890424 RepID=UPI0016290FBE|nr:MULTISPECIES: hypothetical protein [unclassified Synechococcus]MBC1262202.1 hypothetical protein [Synechococcus sp. BSF8S]MBC1265133.1 hypothetical protein [Synechococcus sp. BSA11S]
MRSALSLAVLSAFTVSTLPVRAFPGASVNLVRVNGDGVTAIPGLQRTPTTAAPPSLASDSQLLSQAELSDQESRDVTYLLSGDEDFEIRYASPLPLDLTGNISIRRRSANSGDGANGEEVESIPLNSPNVTISEDRLTLTIKHDRELRDGETLCALLPDGPAALPQRLTPCCFQLAKAATSMARKTTPCGLIPPAANNPFPWWVIPVGLGLGVGICAAAGCFSGGGGGGGSNNVSR